MSVNKVFIVRLSAYKEMSILIKNGTIIAQLVKNLPAKKEMQVPSLDWEDPLEKETATLSNINMCVCV